MWCAPWAGRWCRVRRVRGLMTGGRVRCAIYLLLPLCCARDLMCMARWRLEPRQCVVPVTLCVTLISRVTPLLPRDDFVMGSWVFLVFTHAAGRGVP